MKVGDLVKFKRPTTRNFNKVFLVIATTRKTGGWIKVQGKDGWQPATDFEVVNESR